MGFGYNLAVAFIFPALLLISVVVLIYAIGSKRFTIIKKLFWVWGFLLLIPTFIIITTLLIHFFTDKKKLSRNDIYGSYIIDRSMFSGINADWQYNHYRFEINRKNEFKFHVTDRNKILKTINGRIEFLDGYEYRLRIKAGLLNYNIIDPEPTLFRRVFSFYYVFKSPLYSNMFFTKGEWKYID